MEWVLPTLMFLLVIAATGMAAYLWAARKALADKAAVLQQQVSERDDAIESYLATIQTRDEELKAAGVELATLREREQNFDKRVAQLREEHDKAEARAREAFKNLAADALRTSSEEFLRQARRAFEGEQKQAANQLDQRKLAIENLLKPVRESLDKQARAVSEIEVKREGAYRELRQQVSALVETQARLAGETANLAKAMRRPEVRGRWGEMQLRRVAELAGMIDRCDFTEQVSVRDDEGASLRPDMVVRLPAGREIVVDAKVAFDAYLSALEAESDEDREVQLNRLVGHVEQHVGGLSRKAYTDQFERTPDFVVMFIPLESLLQAVLSRKPGLLEQAMNRNVVIATPSTLIALLKAVAMGWREEQLTQNAARIRDLGQELHERIAIMTEHLTKLGGTLKTTVNHYNRLLGSFDSRVLVTARRFHELGASSSKELPAEGVLETIDDQPRKLAAEEVLDD